MGNLSNEENWAARERLRRIEFLLWWRGWAGRQALMDLFGISPAQASGDLQRYGMLNPEAMVYHTSRKRYESTPGMDCRLHRPDFDDAVRGIFGGNKTPFVTNPRSASETDPRLAVLALPVRSVDCGIARRVVIALLERRTVRVGYLSLRSGKNEARELAPSGLGWDGARWHVRAWCAERWEWRDFVLGRMESVDWPAKSQAEHLPVDTAWNIWETVKLVINPELEEEQRAALRIDYGLSGDCLELRVRQAMKPYLLANLLIEEQSHLGLPRHFRLA